MRSGLVEIAMSNGIPFIDDYAELGLAPEEYTEDKIYDLVEYFGSVYGEDLVLYGGQTATERVYGFKRIRDITNDLDFVCTDQGIRAVSDGRERLFYHPRFDIFFSVRDNVPVSFALTHIHDWPVDRGFFAAAGKAAGFRSPIRCCSREYSIMLKLRRMSGRLDRGEQPFGKDALDIINMAAAPCVRADLPPLDFSLLGSIVADYVTADPERIEELRAFIAGYRDHLTAREYALFAPVLDRFADIGRNRWKS